MILVHQLEKIMKIDNIPVESEDRLNRQKILVELNTSLFPDNIISEFNNTYIDLYNKENPKNLVSTGTTIIPPPPPKSPFISPINAPNSRICSFFTFFIKLFYTFYTKIFAKIKYLYYNKVVL